MMDLGDMPKSPGEAREYYENKASLYEKLAEADLAKISRTIQEWVEAGNITRGQAIPVIALCASTLALVSSAYHKLEISEKGHRNGIAGVMRGLFEDANKEEDW
jgi:hypothetical protein